jgi:hypothetical protein
MGLLLFTTATLGAVPLLTTNLLGRVVGAVVVVVVLVLVVVVVLVLVVVLTLVVVVVAG